MSANFITVTNCENQFFSAHDSARHLTDHRLTAAQTPKPEAPRLIADKLIVPHSTAPIQRQRLQQLLSKTTEQFNATLICGRAGTGKTALAAEFARGCGRAVAWYKIESADDDWTIFSSYLAGCFEQFRSAWQNSANTHFAQPDDCANDYCEVCQATELLTARLQHAANEKPLLLVLDNAHCVFDAAWFAEFFQTLLPLLGANIHLLMLSRSLPPIPLWRMRSKQMLGVVDENLLKFTVDEAVDLFADYNLSASLAKLAHRDTYGRAAKIMQSVESFSAHSTNWVL